MRQVVREMENNWETLFQALLKARSKNQQEERKLRELLHSLNKSKTYTQFVYRNEIFEQKRLVFKMRKEVRDIRAKEEKERHDLEKRLLESQKMMPPLRGGVFLTEVSLAEQEPFPSIIQNVLQDGHYSVLPVNNNQAVTTEKQHKDTEQNNNIDPTTEDVPVKTEPETKKKIDHNVWPGDPSAIGSVRRPRKTAAEMLQRNVSHSGMRKGSSGIDQIKICSRGCNRPSAVMETDAIGDMGLPMLKRKKLPPIKTSKPVENVQLNTNSSSMVVNLPPIIEAQC